jgi:hypothetical protein
LRYKVANFFGRKGKGKDLYPPQSHFNFVGRKDKGYVLGEKYPLYMGLNND